MLIFMFPPLRAQHSCSASDWKLKQLTAAVIVIAQVEELASGQSRRAVIMQNGRQWEKGDS